MDKIQKVLINAGRRDLAQLYYKKIAVVNSVIKNKALEIRKLIEDEPLDYDQFMQTDSSYQKFKALKLIKDKSIQDKFEEDWNTANNSSNWRTELKNVFEKYKIFELFKKEQQELEKENNKKIDTIKREIFNEYPVLEKIQKQTNEGDISFIVGMYQDKNYIHLEFDSPWTSGYDNEYRKTNFNEKELAQLEEYVSMFQKRKKRK